MQRERLLDAIVQVVAEDGYENAGVRAICQRAGVAANTFYELFGSKERLYLAAYDSGVETLFREARNASLAGSDVPWRRRVDAGLGSFLRALADNPQFAQFFAVEIHKAGPEARLRINQSFEAAFRLFGVAGAAEGLSVPIEHLAPLVIGGIYTHIYFFILDGRTDELPKLLPALTAFVLAVFEAPGSG